MKKLFTLFVVASVTVSNLFGLLIYDPLLGIFDNSGSALCENLQLKYTLPDSLKTGYNYNVVIEKNSETRELSISYKFIPGKTSVFTTEIINDLTGQFLPLTEFTSEQRNWSYLINVDVSGKIANYSRFVDPYTACEEITSTCEEVRYIKKSIRFKNYCGSAGKPYVLSPVISQDSLKIISVPVSVPAVCVPTLFGVDSEVVVFTGLKNLDYNIFRQATYYMIYTTVYSNQIVTDTVLGYNFDSLTITTPIIWYPSGIQYFSFIGDADLTSCKEVGVDPNENKAYDLYPNPVSNVLNISNYEGQIKLTNQVGSQFVIEGNHRFDVSSLPKGLYIVHFELNGQIQQEKVIIK